MSAFLAAGAAAAFSGEKQTNKQDLQYRRIGKVERSLQRTQADCPELSR